MQIEVVKIVNSSNDVMQILLEPLGIGLEIPVNVTYDITYDISEGNKLDYSIEYRKNKNNTHTIILDTWAFLIGVYHNANKIY